MSMFRVELNYDRIFKIAHAIKSWSLKAYGMNFYSFPDSTGGEIVFSDYYPSMGHPQTVDFFGLWILQNHRFCI